MTDQSFSDWWLLHKDELMQDESVGVREIAEAAWNELKKQTEDRMSAFVDLAEQVRSAQKTYYRDRTQTNLIASKTVEGKLDRAIADYKHGTRAVQLSLTENGGGVNENY